MIGWSWVRRILQSGKGEFSIPLLVNYEDTDAGGVVYYANYLGYMERARNAYLRRHGFPVSVLVDKHGILFVVREAKLRYLLPAKLDDELEITLDKTKIRGAVIKFSQKVFRGRELLVKGDLTLATVNSGTFKPCRVPDFLRACFGAA